MDHFTLFVEEWYTEVEIDDWRQLSFYAAFIHNGYWSTINKFVAPFLQSTYFHYGTVNNMLDLSKLTPVWMDRLVFVARRALKINISSQPTDWLFVNKFCGLLSTLRDTLRDNANSNETSASLKAMLSWSQAND